jgi:hypothetical protein
MLGFLNVLKLSLVFYILKKTLSILFFIEYWLVLTSALHWHLAAPRSLLSISLYSIESSCKCNRMADIAAIWFSYIMVRYKTVQLQNGTFKNGTLHNSVLPNGVSQNGTIQMKQRHKTVCGSKRYNTKWYGN